jgi:hypothetical protein
MMRSGTLIIAAVAVFTSRAALPASQDQPLPLSCATLARTSTKELSRSDS